MRKLPTIFHIRREGWEKINMQHTANSSLDLPKPRLLRLMKALGSSGRDTFLDAIY